MTAGQHTAIDAPADLLARADRLQAEGRLHAAASTLEQIDRDARDPLIDVRIVDLRHRCFYEEDLPTITRTEQADLPPDLFPGVLGVPEVPSAELDVVGLQSALYHHGALIVRGLLDDATCARTRDDIDTAFDAYDERALRPVEQTAPWYADLVLHERDTPLDPIAGAFLREAGGVYAPCAPRAFVEYRQALEASGVLDVVTHHLGAMPVLSVNKCVLRRVGGGARPSWHQDGLYLGTDARAVNLWVALTRCGGDTDVMGLDVVPGRRTSLAEMGTHDAIDPRAVSQHVAEELAAESGRPIERPVFDPGDGILFDQFFLHRSDVRPLPALRYAVESWFFEPATYSEHQIPVVAC